MRLQVTPVAAGCTTDTQHLYNDAAVALECAEASSPSKVRQLVLHPLAINLKSFWQASAGHCVSWTRFQALALHLE